MATYKVIQDIEAEDKLLGPLTMRQFLYAAIAIGCLYLSFLAATKGAGFLIIFLSPPMFLFGFLAWPFSRDQPTEVWVLAKLRFMIKPRRRIWDQSGMSDLVTITAPKKEEKVYTDGLSQVEVKSRLQALANTLDSRGWAVKNMNVNLFAQPQYALSAASDRLVDMSSLPQEVSSTDVTSSDDIMDAASNPVAQNLDRMIHEDEKVRRAQLMAQMQQPGGPTTTQAPVTDYWFMGQPTGSQLPSGQTVFDTSTVVLPGVSQTSAQAAGPATPDEEALLSKLHKQRQTSAGYGHMRTIKPLGDSPAATTPSNPPQTTSPATPDPAILGLANNNDLNVATLARQANKQKSGSDDGEVVISLR